jgi:tRNA(Ile)-lysidine synthase
MPESDATHLVDTAAATTEAYDMLPAGSPVIAMVSGGADSVALLRLLVAGLLGERLELRALHVNHMLRGEQSDADERFVEELCAELGVDLHVERVDVAAAAEDDGLNLEDAGRRVRYAVASERLAHFCEELGIDESVGRIAVAHTWDDRAETFLMRLAQGSGASGLTSLRPVRERIVRPLVGCTRAAVRAYLESLSQAWREDASNEDTERLRARVRHELLPAFRDINPRFDDALERALGILAEEDELFEEMAEAFAVEFVELGEGEIGFDRALMSTLSMPMRRRTVRVAIAVAFPHATRLDYEHIEALALGIEDERFAHDLPDGLRAFAEYDRMVVASTGDDAPALESGSLPMPGTLDLGAAGGIVAEETSPDDVAGTPVSIVVDAGGIEAGLEIGGPRDGERMRPLGMEGTRKISDMLTDAKIPRRHRGMRPVVRDGERVVWLAGVRMSEEYKVTPETERAVRLTWTPAGDGSE